VAAPADRQRQEVYYSGRVQGVGFRYTVRAVAMRLPVTGYVRNLPDGRVEMIVEGPADEIRRLLDGVDAELGGYITDVRQTTSPATDQFLRFEIRY
jgi:acylphosphatase